MVNSEGKMRGTPTTTTTAPNQPSVAAPAAMPAVNATETHHTWPSKSSYWKQRNTVVDAADLAAEPDADEAEPDSTRGAGKRRWTSSETNGWMCRRQRSNRAPAHKQPDHRRCVTSRYVAHWKNTYLLTCKQYQAQRSAMPPLRTTSCWRWLFRNERHLLWVRGSGSFRPWSSELPELLPSNRGMGPRMSGASTGSRVVPGVYNYTRLFLDRWITTPPVCCVIQAHFVTVFRWSYITRGCTGWRLWLP